MIILKNNYFIITHVPILTSKVVKQATSWSISSNTIQQLIIGHTLQLLMNYY